MSVKIKSKAISVYKDGKDVTVDVFGVGGSSSEWSHQRIELQDDALMVEVSVPEGHDEILYDYNFVEAESNARTGTNYMRVCSHNSNNQSYMFGLGLIGIGVNTHASRFRVHVNIIGDAAIATAMKGNNSDVYEDPSTNAWATLNSSESAANGAAMGKDAVQKFLENHKLYFMFDGAANKVGKNASIEVWSRKS